jgi:hypothetical protein
LKREREREREKEREEREREKRGLEGFVFILLEEPGGSLTDLP